MKKLLLLCCLPLQLLAQQSADKVAAWQQQTQRITIIRDNWGVPHIYGKKDADCALACMLQCIKISEAFLLKRVDWPSSPVNRRGYALSRNNSP